MVRNSSSAKTKTAVRSGRVVSAMLLVLIAYGATVQAVHKHGVVADPLATAVSLPTSEDSTTNSLAGCADCLICQLQQSFSTPLVTHSELEPPAIQVVGFFVTGSLPASSFVTISQSGRAPPLIS